MTDRNNESFEQQADLFVENPTAAEFAEPAETAETAESAERAEYAQTVKMPEEYTQPQGRKYEKQQRRAEKQAAKAAELRPRYVGRFTLGLILILVGVAITASMLNPELNLLYVVKFTPLVLVVLGVEILIAACRRGDRQVKVGFGLTLLCLLLIGGSVGLAVLPDVWEQYGPARWAREQEMADEITRQMYEQIDPADVESIYVHFDYIDANNEPHFRMDVELTGEFESAEAFAEAAAPMAKAISSTDVEWAEIHQSSECESWRLELHPIYPWKDAEAADLVGRVHHSQMVMTEDGFHEMDQQRFDEMTKNNLLATPEAVKAAYEEGREKGRQEAWKEIDAETLRKEGYDQGFEEGRQKGAEEARRDAE